jgi:hypothetical protein
MTRPARIVPNEQDYQAKSLRSEWMHMQVIRLEKRTFWMGVLTTLASAVAIAALVWAFVLQRQMETRGAEHYSLNGKIERALGESR